MELPPAIGDWASETIEQLVKEKVEESIYLDYKQNFDLEKEREKEYKRELQRDFCAFANLEGGFIIFGIEEIRERGELKDLKIKGITVEKEPGIKISEILQNVDPPIKTENKIIELEGKKILVVKIHKAKDQPTACADGSYFIRISSTKQPIPRHILANWFISRDVIQQRRGKLLFEIDTMIKICEQLMKSQPKYTEPKFSNFRVKEIGNAFSEYYYLYTDEESKNTNSPHSHIPTYGAFQKNMEQINFEMNQHIYTIAASLQSDLAKIKEKI